MTMQEAELIARRIARTEGVAMVWGWQQSDDTGEREPGYCPAAVVGPCFVYEVVGKVSP
jgi:hypothetical protein